MMRILVCLAILLAAPAASASSDATQTAERPRIGLVLSGGGARGAAHIGVLKVLERHRIPVDVIAGTSFGAIIGGLYATGLSAEELEERLLAVDWEFALRDTVPRRLRSMRRKDDDDNFLVKFKLGVNDGEIALPPGVILNEHFRILLREYARGAATVTDFDKLPIPFRAVAADIETGEPVVLGGGSLVQSILASMAVPGLFPPVKLDDRLLVDGGIANNVPIDVARAMGADILIVVDISSPPKPQAEIESFLDVVSQMVTIMTLRTAEQQMTTLGPHDVAIRPDLEGISTADFKRTPEAIPFGERAAEDALQSLAALSLGETAWAAYRAGRGQAPPTPTQVDFVRLDNDSALDNRVILELLDVHPGRPLDPERLEDGIIKVYGLDYFESVDYELVREDGQTGIEVTAKERSWGPDYLRFGLAIQDNFEGDATYNAAISYTDLGINSRGGEWRSSLQVGDDPQVFTEIYQPVDYGQQWFVLGNVTARSLNAPLIDPDRNVIAEFRLKAAEFFLAGGRNLGNWGRLALGAAYEIGDVSVRIGNPAIPTGNFEEADLIAVFQIDTLDNADFPRTGLATSIFYRNGLPILGSDATDDQVQIELFKAWSWGANTILGTAEFGAGFNGRATAQSLFELGGFVSLSGFSRGELTGRHVTQAGVIYYRQIGGRSGVLLNIPIYAGATVEAGNVWQDLDDFAVDDLIVGSSLFLGAETVIGPVYVGGGVNTEGATSFFLFLGQFF